MKTEELKSLLIQSCCLLEIQSVVDGTEFKELYDKLNSTDKEKVKKTLYNQYGNDIQKVSICFCGIFSFFNQMRAKAKDGTLKEAFNDEECIIFFCFPCFSGSSTVRSQRGELPIRDLKLGDFILTQSPGKESHFTEVRQNVFVDPNRAVSGMDGQVCLQPCQLLECLDQFVLNHSECKPCDL